jgi:hypothetical protein
VIILRRKAFLSRHAQHVWDLESACEMVQWPIYGFTPPERNTPPPPTKMSGKRRDVMAVAGDVAILLQQEVESQRKHIQELKREISQLRHALGDEPDVHAFLNPKYENINPGYGVTLQQAADNIARVMAVPSRTIVVPEGAKVTETWTVIPLLGGPFDGQDTKVKPGQLVAEMLKLVEITEESPHFTPGSAVCMASEYHQYRVELLQKVGERMEKVGIYVGSR